MLVNKGGDNNKKRNREINPPKEPGEAFFVRGEEVAALGGGDDDPCRGKWHIPRGKIEPCFKYLRGEEAEEEKREAKCRKAQKKWLAY